MIGDDEQEQITEEDQDGLSPAELEALGITDDEDDSEDDETDDSESTDSDDEDQEGDDSEDSGDTDGSSDEESDDDSTDDDDSEDVSDEESDDDSDEGQDDSETDEEKTAKPEEKASTLPQYSIDEDGLKAAKKTIEGIEDEYDALSKEFTDGDKDEAEYHKAFRAINRKEMAAQTAINSASNIASINAENQKSDWETAQENFLNHPDNIVFRDNDIVFGAFETAFSKVQDEPDSQGKSYSWLLNKAGEAAKEALGISDIDTKEKDEKVSDEAKKKLDKRKAKKEKQKVPESLGGKTSVQEQNDEYKGKFAHLNGLNGDALETALAALSPTDQDEYLRDA